MNGRPCGPLSLHKPARAQSHVEPYGISLVGGPETNRWAASERAVAAQITASKRYWHANTVRMQVSESQLLDSPSPRRDYNVPFAASVNRLVCQILRQGQIPVINDTTLFTTPERGPTPRTVRFWKFMSSQYGNRYPVVFDLFNEPRLNREFPSGRFLPMARVWRLWHDGGQLNGQQWVGMQRLVDTIRGAGARNVIWAEEPWFLMPQDLRIDLLPRHLLRGRDIVYAFHKATLAKGSASLRQIRDLARRGIPLVDSEWSQFAATDRPWECFDNAYERTPRYLAFLRRLGIGLIAWSLQPGALVQGQAGIDTVNDGNDTRYTTDPGALAKASTLQPSYGCNRSSRGQGAGALIKAYFARYSNRVPADVFPEFG